ncbi:hypothetical protein DSCW_36830 [Desulfosarcina widdelii]|uniref:Uncharacterized protein n=1 Tax=Desulfosarcina widdelii TaxID=947919 RepID=A0A5K7Z3D7_9BACT|nr:hypothetical protein [Desulfosarcina widdelii]BBO76266.1 hypothetical protein DSCW_36830 [Desulfosarcina widdelii]
MCNNDESTMGAFSVHNAAGIGGMGAALYMPGVRMGDGYRLNDNGQVLGAKMGGKTKKSVSV